MSSEIKGEIIFGPGWLPFRILAIVSGFFLIQGFWNVVTRFLLGFKRVATLRLGDSHLELKGEYYLFGRVFRRMETRARISDLDAVRIENRTRYLHILFGFGFLMVGTFIGMQWFVDGLKAGYPYLMLIGAGAMLLGIAIDFGFFVLVPRGDGRTRLILHLGPWRARMVGIDEDDARTFARQIANRFESGS